MECIEELKKLGIEKISAKTRITQDKIQSIINLEFGAFDRVRARGFLQIIEREFGLDLSEWLAEFDSANAAKEASLAPESEAHKNINIQINSTKKDESFLPPLVLLGLAIAAFAVYFIYNHFTKSPEIIHKEAQNPAASVDSVVLNDLMDSSDLAESNADSSDSSGESAESSEDSSANLPANPSANPNPNLANPSTNPAANPAANPTLNATANPSNTVNPSANLTPKTTRELVITPNEPLWIGVVNLSKNRKRQAVISQNYSIALDGEKIIATGHSHFEASDGADFTKKFTGGDKKYFHFTESEGLSEITRADFLRLNGGAEW